MKKAETVKKTQNKNNEIIEEKVFKNNLQMNRLHCVPSQFQDLLQFKQRKHELKD